MREKGRYMGKPKEGGISANWESSHTILFCDLCIREIELGNRPTTHFSKDGWKNLVTKFKDGSGLLYDRAQLKNKWDQLKREWKLWKDLKKGETGLGWDPIKKTIDASDLWWQERIKMIPLAKKFRYAGIAPELEERLDSMFRQVVATGRNVWFPAAGNMPPLFADEEVVLVDEDNSTELGDGNGLPTTDEDEYEMMCNTQMNRQQEYVLFSNVIASSVGLVHEFVSFNSEKTPCMTSQQTGDKWLCELIAGHPIRFHNMFRMSKEIFFDLLSLLERSYEFKGSQRTAPREILAVTLYILAHNEAIRLTSERFQHSTETISRFFSMGLKAITRLSLDIISPEDKLFREIPTHILHDGRYMPYFRDCIGAIDGTHVDACIPVAEQVPYIGRHGTPTQNVMAICDFNMCFTYVVPGWEGSAHDSRIFHDSYRDPRCKFPYPPQGKYYLVDAGYPLQTGLLKPYPETRYHLPDFARGARPIQGRREKFNKAHSSLRSVIERTFGVWKKRWSILRGMPQYNFSKQCVIVVATMALHNFIRRHPSHVDLEFGPCDEDETLVYPEAYEHRTGENQSNADPNSDPINTEGSGSTAMAALRDFIANQIQNS